MFNLVSALQIHSHPILTASIQNILRTNFESYIRKHATTPILA